MFCHNCGTQVANDVQFCPSCGQPLATVPLAGSTVIPWTAPAGVTTHTGRWIGAGWHLVKQDIGIFVLVSLLYVILTSAVPLLINGALAAGLHIFCMKKLLGRRVELADLFKGFNFFIPVLVASLLIWLFTLAGTLLCVIPGLVVAAMYNFTYLFIVDKRMDFWQAMQSSHTVVKNDYFGFTMFLLALVGVNLLGLLCCIVGLLVTIPATFAAVTAAYQELVGFEQRTVDSL